MKILMICDFFHENHQYQENLLIKYYLKHGHIVSVVASTFSSIFDYYSENYNPKAKFQEYEINGYKIIRRPYLINIFNKVRMLKSLKTVIKEEKPDLIYVHGVPLNLLDSISYKKVNPKCKLLFDSHADYSNSAKNWFSLNILHKIFYRTILKICYKNIDKIFYITPNTGIFLNEVYRIPKNRMALLPLGADIDYIKEIKEINKPGQIRDELGINKDDFVIFTGGKFTREKKMELVIKSFFLIELKTAHLIIVGDTKDKLFKDEILNLIDSHPRIHMVGWVEGEKVYDYISPCDVAIFPASQSVLWQQAIGSGLPLIIGKEQKQDATYLNKNNNIIFIEKDCVTSEEIYLRIKLLIEDKFLLSTMKQNAMKTCEEFLSYDRIAYCSINNE